MQVAGCESADSREYGEAMHRTHHSLGIAHSFVINVCDAGRAAWGCLNKSSIGEFEQRLAHGRSRDAEPLGQLLVAHSFPRGESAIDDRGA